MPALLFNLKKFKFMNSIEQFWDEILSRDPIRIERSLKDLSDSDRQAVVDHLTLMTTEDGWHSSQKRSAQIALETINKDLNKI